MTKITPVIFCGGSGTRLWPLLREHFPKVILRLVGEITLLQKRVIQAVTFEYIKKIIKRQLINNQEKLLEIMVVQTEEKVVEDGRKCFKYVYG